MAEAARFFAKVYTFDGATFRCVVDATQVLAVPSIVREVNKPTGEMRLQLALPFDGFGYGTKFDNGNLVKLYAVNESNKTGLLVYQGIIEELDGVFSRSSNNVTIRTFPIDSLLDRTPWKALGSYIVTYPAGDVDTIFSDAIDDMNSIYGTVFSKNLGDPGLTINQTFTRITHLAAINLITKLLPDGWYWRILPTGQIDLGQFDDVNPTHKLVVGKTVDSVHVVKSSLNLKNKVIVSWGPGPTDSEYSDAPSITAYGQRALFVTDAGINDLATANIRGASELAKRKGVTTKTEIIVNTQYPIETIRPGDTVTVSNVSDTTSQMLTGVLRVIRTEYDGATMNLHLGDVMDNFGNELEILLDQ